MFIPGSSSKKRKCRFELFKVVCFKSICLMIVTFLLPFYPLSIDRITASRITDNTSNALRNSVLFNLCNPSMAKREADMLPDGCIAKRLRSSMRMGLRSDASSSLSHSSAQQNVQIRKEFSGFSTFHFSHEEINALRHASSEPEGLCELELNDQIQTIIFHLLAIQSQELESTLLSIWTRLKIAPADRPNRKELLRTLQSLDGHVVRFWGNRVTLQLATRERRKMLCAAVQAVVRRSRTASTLRGTTNKVALSLTLKNAESKLANLVRENGEASTNDCARVIEEEAKKADLSLDKETATRVRGAVRVFLTVDGVARRAISADRQATLFLDCDGRDSSEQAMDASGEQPRVAKVECDIALQACASAYFRAYGPATERDFRYWMGISAIDSQTAVSSLQSSGTVCTIDTERGTMLVPTTRDVHTAQHAHNVLLRGRFDPVLLAHADKTWVVQSDWRSRVWSRNADVAAVVLVRGFIVGVWHARHDRLTVDLFDKSLDPDILAAVSRTATDMATYFYDGFQVVISDS